MASFGAPFVGGVDISLLCGAAGFRCCESVSYAELSGTERNSTPALPTHPLSAPADVQQLPDGSLLVSDDGAHTVYRISYVGGNSG
jgi:hypothetical protein